MAEQLRKSSRSVTVPTGTRKKDKDVHTKRKREEMSDSAPIINESTPRTLLENVIQGHNTVHASTKKRPRLERSPVVSPRVQRYSPRRQMVIPSPGSSNSSPTRSIRASPNRSINRSRSSLRKRATMKNFLAQGANAVGPSPRTMIEGIINEAAEETTITGTRLRSAAGNTNDTSESSLFLDKTRDQFRYDTSKDSFLTDYPDIQSSDRMRVLRSRHQRNKPSVNVDLFVADVNKKIKDNITVMNSTRKLDTTVNVREIADEIFKDVSLIEPESLPSKINKQSVVADAGVHVDSMQTEIESHQVDHQDQIRGSQGKVTEISEGLKSREREDKESSSITHELTAADGTKLGDVNTESVRDERSESEDDDDQASDEIEPSIQSIHLPNADDPDSSTSGNDEEEKEDGEKDEDEDGMQENEDDDQASEDLESTIHQSIHAPIVDDPDRSASENSREEKEGGEIDEDEVGTRKDEDHQADVTAGNQSERGSESHHTEDGNDNHEGELNQDRPDSEVELRDDQRGNNAAEDDVGGGDISDEDTENVPSDFEDGAQTSSKHTTPAKLVQLKITDVLHTPGQMNLLNMMETPGMNTSLRTLTRPNVGNTTKQPTTKPGRVGGKKRTASGTAKKVKAPSLPASLTKSIFQHFSRRRVNKQVMEEVESVANEFWNNATSDLAAYAEHGHRKGLEEKDIELLMKRQGFVDDTHSMHALIENYLPLEYRQELIPIARSGNILQPKK